MVDIGKRIKNKRIENGLTQEELATKMGYKTKSTINKIENGVNDVAQKNIYKFAEVLNTSIAYLMGWEEDKNATDIKIGKQISKLRNDNHLSLVELSNELGLDLETLSEYENGTKKIPLDILIKLSHFFHISLDSLAGVMFEKKYDDTESAFLTKNKKHLEKFNRWIQAVGDETLTDEEFEKVLDFAKFLLNQRKK